MKKKITDTQKNLVQESQIPKDLLDNLSFTASSKQLEELKKQIFNSREIKNNKIAIIKDMLEKNQYQISSKGIAEKLLEELEIIKEVEPA